jgi:hypothetical protein
VHAHGRFEPSLDLITPNVSHPDYCLGPRAGKDSSADESGEDGFEIEATIEAILHLGKIAVGILGKLERMVGARNRCLEVWSTVFTRRNSWRVTAWRPEPTTIAVWQATSPATALKQ